MTIDSEDLLLGVIYAALLGIIVACSPLAHCQGNAIQGTIITQPVTVESGVGPVTHITGPPDQPLKIGSSNNQNIVLAPNGTGVTQANGTLQMTGGTGLGSFTSLTVGGTATIGAIMSAALTGAGSGNKVTRLYEVFPGQAAITAPVVTYSGGAGAGTCGYKLEIRDNYGNIAAVSAAGTATSTNGTLDGSHTCTIPCPSSFSTYDQSTFTCNVFRTTTPGTPATLGKICTGTAPGANCVDNGLAGDQCNGATHTPGTLCGTGAAQTMFSYSPLGTQMQPGKGIKATYIFNHSTGTANVAYRVLYGGSACGTLSNATTGVEKITHELDNAPGITNSQYCSADQPGVQPAQATLAIDSTTTQPIASDFNVAATDQETPIRAIWELSQ